MTMFIPEILTVLPVRYRMCCVQIPIWVDNATIYHINHQFVAVLTYKNQTII